MTMFFASMMMMMGFASPPIVDSPNGALIAQCIVDNDIRDVKVLLDTVPGSAAEKAVAPKVLDYYGGCNDNQGAAGVIAWRDRAEIAHAALLKRIGGASPDSVAASGRVGWQLTLAAEMTPGDYDASSVGMRQFGDCVVARAPAEALNLVRAAAGSATESAATSALQPALGPCAPAGQSLRFKRQDLRLIVAEPLYHMLLK